MDRNKIFQNGRFVVSCTNAISILGGVMYFRLSDAIVINLGKRRNVWNAYGEVSAVSYRCFSCATVLWSQNWNEPARALSPKKGDLMRRGVSPWHGTFFLTIHSSWPAYHSGFLGEGTFSNAGVYWGTLLLTRRQLSFPFAVKIIYIRLQFNPWHT